MTETLPARTTDDDPPPTGGLARGASVARYLIVDCVGRGGMGVVYRAYDPDLDRAIAIKLVRADSRNSERRQRLRARLVSEAKMLAQLSHPNVVAVYDVGPFEDGAFVAMELIEGDTLRATLAQRPSFARVVELFAAAGRGLAAAHAIGIIHRDFKPDNVVVASDGTARVLDFGLARAIDGDDGASTDGAILGTPGYMAPEQIAGGEVDERTDQYSFCVALHEGLFGTLPVADPTSIPGRTRSGVRVPRRMRDAIRRGLSGSRTARHASMAELLDALALTSPRRRVVWLGGLAAVVAGAALVVAARGDRPAPSCDVPESGLMGAWDPVRSAAVHDALHHSGDDAAAETVERTLDRYVASWREMSGSSCRATQAGQQSAELLDLRAECLDHRLAEIRELTTLLARADATTAGHAVDSVRELSPIEDCANATALRDAIPPRDPARAHELRDRLAQQHARFAVASYAEVVTGTRQLAELAASAGDGWLVASAQFLQARASRELGRLDDAEDQLYRAVATAESARASDVAVRAWTSLAWVIGEDRHRPVDGLRLAQVARGALDRIGGGIRLEAPLEDDIGVLELDRDQLDQARVHAQRAVEIGKRAFGEDSEYAIYLQHLALVEGRSGHRDTALELYRRAHRIAEVELGPRHPTVLVIAGAEGAALGELGRSDDEIRLLEPALAHADPTSDVAASLLVNLGLAYWKAGRLDDAKAADLRGLTIARGHDPHGDRTASLELDLALVLLDRGELPDARAHATAAVVALDDAARADPRSLAEALQVSAQADLRAGRVADAVPALERELAILVGAKAAANDIAATRFDLAKATLARRDPARARSLAEAARDELHQAGDSDGVREVTAWLQRL